MTGSNRNQDLWCYWVLRTRTNKLFTFENEAYNFPEQYILRVLISLPTNKTPATFVVSAIVDDNYSCFEHEPYNISKQRVVRVLIHYHQTNHSPFLDSFRKLAAIFATLGRFEEAYYDFPTL